jgi:hypothetical protein
MIPGFIEGLENYLLVRPFYSSHLAYGFGGAEM